MSLKLNPYPEYKDSWLPWLGEIPAHWNLKRAKLLFREIDDRTETGQEMLLSMRHDRGLVPHNDVSDKEVSDADLIGYKRTWPGDIVMNRMRASSGLFAETFVNGLVSPDYAVFQPITANVDGGYFVRLFKCPAMGAKFRAESKGLGTGTAGFLRLYSDSFGALALPVPSRREQTAIVRFLMAQNQQFAHFIRAKQRLIELLNEQKQAIIQQAVTRGLDLKVPIKQTASDWLPKVPEHWELVKLRRIVHLNPSKSEVAADRTTPENVVFLPMEKVSEDGDIDCTERRTLAEAWEGFTYFRKHDVIVAKITPCFENGKGAHLGSLESELGFGSTEFTVLRAGSRILPEFLYRVTASPWFRRLGAESMTGAAGQKRVPNDFIKNFDVALPPLDEQERIVGFIGKKERLINLAIQRAQREIEFIREYRTRLISDVVTGKLDVREVELPHIEEQTENVPSIATENGDPGQLLTAEEVGDVNL